MVTKKVPGAKRGRPSKPLRLDPDRYRIARDQALIDHGMSKGLSEMQVLEALVSLRYGTLELGTPETRANFENFATGKPFKVKLDSTKVKIQGDFEGDSPKGKPWSLKNVFHTLANNRNRKMRRARKNPAIDEDARWLAVTSFIWKICLNRRVDLTDCAEWMAAKIGETNHFNEEMRPLLLGENDPLLILGYLVRHDEGK